MIRSAFGHGLEGIFVIRLRRALVQGHRRTRLEALYGERLDEHGGVGGGSLCKIVYKGRAKLEQVVEARLQRELRMGMPLA